jgi:hypothetical protein
LGFGVKELDEKLAVAREGLSAGRPGFVTIR